MASLAAALLLGISLGTVWATPVPTAERSPLTLVSLQGRNIQARDILVPLQNNASGLEHKFQPVLDFDTDGCYYTAAIDASGKLNPGLDAAGSWNPFNPECLRERCRDANRLQHNNLYSRSRCNNGWCAIM
jgi:hypothetical protein